MSGYLNARLFVNKDVKIKCWSVNLKSETSCGSKFILA